MNDETLDLALFTKKVLEKVLGHALDLARISEMGERAFGQYEKSIKNYVRETINNSVHVLSEYNKFEVNIESLKSTPREGDRR
jgi:hypothetical protein